MRGLGYSWSTDMESEPVLGAFALKAQSPSIFMLYGRNLEDVG